MFIRIALPPASAFPPVRVFRPPPCRLYTQSLCFSFLCAAIKRHRRKGSPIDFTEMVG